MYLPRLSYTDLQVTASDVPAYLTAWLKWICQHYTYTTGVIFIAPVWPSTQGIAISYIYDTTPNESGLPQYGNGLMFDTGTDLTLTTFGVYDWQFYTSVIGANLAYAQGTLPVEHGGTGGTTKQTAREGLGFTQVGNSTTPVYFNSNAFPAACTPYSSASVYSAGRLTTARTIRTNLGSTSAASFNGTVNITPGVTGVLPIANGGTGAASAIYSRGNLGVPAEIDIGDGASGFPFSYGTVVARGYLGNTTGQATSDNYYWGVDSTATLWGGQQTNRATSPTWYKAMMMDGSQDNQRLWSGNLSGTGSITITNANKFTALILCGFPGSTDEDLQFACVPAGSASPCQFCSNQYWFTYSLTSSGNNITIKIIENPDGGSFRFCWGILRHTS